MAIELISKIKPKNNGAFAMVDAVDVQVDEHGTRLSNLFSQVVTITATLEDGTTKTYSLFGSEVTDSEVTE